VRKFRSRAAGTLLAVCVGVACAHGDGVSYDYVQLLSRLTDAQQLAVLPAKGETVAMVSSFNRRSRYDASSDRYIDWGANADGGANADLKPDADGNVVLADLKGPGCIWRIWAANSGKGHVKIFIDGAEVPAIDLPLVDYFTGKHAPFNRRGITYQVASGNDSYVPIPYQKSLKIVAAKGWGEYYQFTYSTFPEGTSVPSFKRELTPEESTALDRASERLTKPAAEQTETVPDAKVERKEVEIAPGKSVAAIDFSGSGAITEIRASVADLVNRADQINALRELTLAIRWDGEKKPAVWSPLGDFFGSAMGVNAYQSAMSGMNAGGLMYSRWYMPFEKGATIEITNDGALPRKVAIEVTREPLTKPIGELGRFHAKWHRDAFNSPRADRWPDWTMLTTEGRGKFVGVVLHVWNPRAGHNRQYGREGDWWWGEGDEKFFVDNEKFPSTFGTGTEDYFGYAWCDPQLFQRPFHGQTLTQLNKGHQSVFRWHFTDAMPFQSRFEGALEKYFANAWPTKYAAIAYWYLTPGGTDPYEAVPLADRTGYYDLNDATEGENLRVTRITGGKAEPQVFIKDRTSGEGLISGGQQLWWTGAKEGDSLSVAVPVAHDGIYRVKLGTLQAPDYGVFEVSFNDSKPLGPINCYMPDAGPMEIDLGEHDLKRGDATLSLKMLPPWHEAKPGNFASIDYVKLELLK
jgi:hypothetical protein